MIVANAFKRFQIIPSANRSRWLSLSSLTGAHIITVLLGLVSSALWARNVDPEVFGQYNVVQSLMGIVGVFCLAGLGESLSISAAKRYDGNLSKILRIRLVGSLVAGLALVGVGLYYQSMQPGLAAGIFLAAILFPLYKLREFWPSWINARGKLNLLAVLRITASVLTVATLAVLIFAKQTSLTALLAGTMIAASLLSLGVVLYMFRSRENRVVDKKTIKYGYHTTAATLFSTLIITDKIIINHHLSATDVAVYSIAMIFPVQITALYSIFNSLLMPNLYKANSVKDAWKYLKPKMALLFILFCFTGIAGFILMPIVIPMIFSERYVEAVPYGKWMWLSLSLVAPATYLGNILRAQQKKAFVYIFSICQPIFLFCMYNFFISWGIKGIVFSRIIFHWSAFFLFICFFFYYLSKEKRTSLAKT